MQFLPDSVTKATTLFTAASAMTKDQPTLPGKPGECSLCDGSPDAGPPPIHPSHVSVSLVSQQADTRDDTASLMSRRIQRCVEARFAWPRLRGGRLSGTPNRE